MVSLTPILNKLFYPTAEYIGDEIKSFLKTKIENAKRANRDKNLAGHFKAAGKLSLSPLGEPSENIQQAEKLEDWIEGAQDVIPDQSELAQLWQQLLRDIVDDKPVERYLLQQAKHLTPLDARLLLKLHSHVGKRPYDRRDLLAIQRLETLGFVESSLKRIWLPVILLSLPLLCLVIFTAIYSFFEDPSDITLMFAFSMLPMMVTLFSQFALVYFLITTVWAIYPYFSTGSVRSFTLSPLGSRLVESVKRTPSTPYVKLFAKNYVIYYHPDEKYRAVKQGISWPSLFLGPLWLIRHSLWKQLVFFCSVFLLIILLYSIGHQKTVHYSIKAAAIGFTTLAWPLYLLSIFAIPFVSVNNWIESKLRERGWIKVDRRTATNASAARSSYIQMSKKFKKKTDASPISDDETCNPPDSAKETVQPGLKLADNE